MATTSYVNTDNVGTADGTSVATGWTSCATAVSNLPATFVDDYIIECSGTAADTSAVTFSGKTFSTFSATIKGNRSEADGFYDGDLIWSTSHYRMTQTASARTINVNVSGADVTVDGVQIAQRSNNFSMAYQFLSVSNGENAVLKNCRIRGHASSLGNGAVYLLLQDNTLTVDIQNNVVEGAEDSGIHVKPNNFFTSHTINITGNTIKDCSQSTGAGIEIEEGNSNTGTLRIQNNAVFDSTTSDFTHTGSGGYTVTNTHNASDDTFGTSSQDVSPGATESTEWPDHFTDPNNATRNSIDLTAVSSGALDGNGTTGTGILTVDILGETRDGSTPTIGAFELAAAGGTTKEETVGITATGAVTVTPGLTLAEALGLTATGTVGVATTLSASEAVALIANGALAADTSLSLEETIALAATAVVTASSAFAGVTKEETIGLTATASLNASVQVTLRAQITLTASGSLAEATEATLRNVTGIPATATVALDSSNSTSMAVNLPAAAVLAAVGRIPGDGEEVALGAVATITASATLVPGPVTNWVERPAVTDIWVERADPGNETWIPYPKSN